ncbi:hypothetical protein [Streptomyces sp. NPDC005476]|uniref:hypothetical protein n=1 Tax=Streptomyces sp. NPDC005476 TaxID=3156882 RepID=UPI003453AAB9
MSRRPTTALFAAMWWTAIGHEVRNIDGRKLAVPISKIRTAAAAAGCAVALIGFATAAPASAAPAAPDSARAGAVAAAGRSDFCDSYVCGSGTFTLSASRKNLTGAMSVRFPCGIGVTSARIRLVTHAVTTGYQYGAWHTTTTCGTYKTFGGLSWTQNESIYEWYIQETRSGGGIANGNRVQI